jgi:hypothetical protein
LIYIAFLNVPLSWKHLGNQFGNHFATPTLYRNTLRLRISFLESLRIFCICFCLNQPSLMILIRYEFLTELKYNIALLVSSLIKDSVPTHLVSTHPPFWTGFFHFFEVFVNKTVLYRGSKDISQEIRQVIICISRIGNFPIIIVLAFKTGCRYLLNYIEW